MEVASKHKSKAANRDWELVQEVIAGNTRAYGLLVGYYKSAMQNYVNKIVNNHTDTEEVTSITFEKAYENLHTFSPTFSFSTWLYKIAQNSAIDYVRKRTKLQKRLQNIDSVVVENSHHTEMNVRIPTNDPDPEEELILKQNSKIMEKFVDQMKGRYRTLIICRFFEEKSYAEIAKELDLPMGTVKARLHRARAMLVRLLNAAGNDLNLKNGGTD